MATLTLNGRTIPLPGPLTVGDWRALARDHGITMSRVAKGLDDPDAFVGLIVYSLKRVDPTVTEAEIDAMTLDDLLVIFEATKAQEAAAAAIDRPTSTPSTSSDGSTAGAPPTSTD